MAVSYTHLDVYKRQAMIEAMNEGKIRVLFGSTEMLGTGCLLYTSIIYHPCLYHPAGFCQRADTRFLVIHPQKHLECLVYHFFPVGNHIGLSSFMSVSYTHLAQVEC